MTCYLTADVPAFAAGYMLTSERIGFMRHLGECKPCRTALLEEMQLRARLSTLTPEPVTADDLTEAQIREFNIALGKAMGSASGAEWRRLADLRDECAFALGGRPTGFDYYRSTVEAIIHTQAARRAVCAALNAPSKCKACGSPDHHAADAVCVMDNS